MRPELPKMENDDRILFYSSHAFDRFLFGFFVREERNMSTPEPEERGGEADEKPV